MANRVHYRENKSLSELEIVPGEFIAFNNDDVEYGGHPFLIAIPEKLEKITPDFYDPNSKVLIFAPKNKDQEYWNFCSKGKVLGIWTPKNWNGIKIPNFSKEDRVDRTYVVDVAYSGNEAVKQGLIESGLESYCEMFGLD